MPYRWCALSLEGFVQQIAVNYLPFGYWFYVTGRVPSGKDPAAIDTKLLAKYGIAVSQWVRARRKRAGQANVQYIRYGEFFVLLATAGQHRFFQEEAESLHDIRRHPLRYGGYSLSHRGGHAHVRIEQRTFQALKAYFLELAVRRSQAQLEAALYALPFEPYAPIRSQYLLLWRKINAVRKAAGLSRLSDRCLPLRRRLYRPFDSPLPRTWGPGKKTLRS